ncbi:MAG: ATPase domain-containing protein [Ferroplasma sp.]
MDKSVIESIISTKFSIDPSKLEIEENKEMDCGNTNFKFEYIATDRENNIAVHISPETDRLQDIIIFNYAADECNFKGKLYLISSELNDYETKLLSGFNIKIEDLRNYGSSADDKRSAFGIPELDGKLSGGLRKGYVYLISGKPGVGKTTLSSIFLANGAKMGERGVMVLTDTYPDQFIRNISTMNIGFLEAFKKKDIEVMEISDQIRSMKFNVSSGTLDFRKFITKLVNELKSFILDNGIKRVVIDPITPLLIANDDYVSLLLNSLSMLGVTVIITSGLRNSDLSVFGMEEYYASGIIKLNYTNGENGLTRSCEIIKMRGTAFDSSPLIYTINSSGISIVKAKKQREEVKKPEKGIQEAEANNYDSSLFKPIR